jgi:hypothetical protein
VLYLLCAYMGLPTPHTHHAHTGTRTTTTAPHTHAHHTVHSSLHTTHPPHRQATMAPRPCLGCGTPTDRPRCRACGGKPSAAKRGLDRTHRRITAMVVEQWVAANGWVCPGYMRDAHPVPEGGLEGEHIIARTIRPDLMHEPSNYSVLCKVCNAHKGNR